MVACNVELWGKLKLRVRTGPGIMTHSPKPTRIEFRIRTHYLCAHESQTWTGGTALRREQGSMIIIFCRQAETQRVSGELCTITA